MQYICKALVLCLFCVKASTIDTRTKQHPCTGAAAAGIYPRSRAGAMHAPSVEWGEGSSSAIFNGFSHIVCK